jgi:hypothetical protein
MKKYLLLFLVLISPYCLDAQTGVNKDTIQQLANTKNKINKKLLIGKWGENKDEEPIFVITKDEVIYVTPDGISDKKIKWEVKGNIYSYYENKNEVIYRGEIIKLDKDSLFLKDIDDDEISKFVRFP